MLLCANMKRPLRPHDTVSRLNSAYECTFLTILSRYYMQVQALQIMKIVFPRSEPWCSVRNSPKVELLNCCLLLTHFNYILKRLIHQVTAGPPKSTSVILTASCTQYLFYPLRRGDGYKSYHFIPSSPLPKTKLLVEPPLTEQTVALSAFQ